MSLIDATMSLIDEDQGVCYDGHACALHIRSGHFDIGVRVCDTVHPDLGNEPYMGDPLVRWTLTQEELDMAIRRGADPTMADTAKDWLLHMEGAER